MKDKEGITPQAPNSNATQEAAITLNYSVKGTIFKISKSVSMECKETTVSILYVKDDYVLCILLQISVLTS